MSDRDQPRRQTYAARMRAVLLATLAVAVLGACVKLPAFIAAHPSNQPDAE